MPIRANLSIKPLKALALPLLALLALLVPLSLAAVTASATAAFLPRDVLIKPPGKGAPVYYLALDNRRYVFPNQRTYETWFSDFSDIHEVSPEQLAEFPLGGNVTYRPGIRMVKITTDPKVYVVDQGACLRWVSTEQLAIALYGSTWNQQIDDVPDAFFFDYKICEPIDSLLAFQPLAVAQTTTSINVLKSLAVSANARIADTQPNVGDAEARDCTPKVDTTKHGLKVAVGDDDLPDETLTALAGGDSVNLARFDFTSENEDLTVSRFSVRVSPSWAVSTLSLYQGDQQISGPLVPDQNGQVAFRYLNVRIAKDETRSLTVRGDLREIGFGSMSSGQPVTVTMVSDFFEAASSLSCSDTYITGGGVLGERLPLTARARTVRQVKPVLSVEPLPDPTLRDGLLPVLRFRISPDGSGDLAFKRLTLSLAGDWQSPLSLAAEPAGLRRLSDGHGLAGDYRLSGNCVGTSSPSCTLVVALDDWEFVNLAAGQEYEVRLNLAGTPLAGDRLDVTMLGDLEPIPSGQYPSHSAYNFIWSDSLFESNGEIDAYAWANGAHLGGLPTAPYALVK